MTQSDTKAGHWPVLVWLSSLDAGILRRLVIGFCAFFWLAVTVVLAA